MEIKTQKFKGKDYNIYCVPLFVGTDKETIQSICEPAFDDALIEAYKKNPNDPDLEGMDWTYDYSYMGEGEMPTDEKSLREYLEGVILNRFKG